MLRQDDHKIADIKKTYKEFFKVIGKKEQLTFKLVNSIHNGKNKQPRSFRIPATYVVNEGGDTHEFTYYKSETKKNIGGLMQSVFSPYYLPEFGKRGDLIVNIGKGQDQNLDLFIALMNHPRRALSKNGEGVSGAIFYLEDTAAEAREYAEIKQAKVKMDALLWNEETMLPAKELRVIAKALRIFNADELSLPELQSEIEKKCKNNPSLFLNMKSTDKDTEMRAMLQDAIEAGHVTYIPATKKWSITDKDSGTSDNMASVRGTEDSMTALVHWLKYKDENDHYGKIVELVTGKPQRKKEQEPDAKDELLAKALERIEALEQSQKQKATSNK